ncbi:MAG TPA: hypothetical protein VFY71_12035 [Planctomycetota bacterium]|nr:hypothetical protein [Planctomycetota bacterium]
MQAQHAKLAKRLAAIDAELDDLGVAVPKRRGRNPGRMPGRRSPGRPKGSKNKRRGRRATGDLTLLDAILKGVRVGTTVSPADAAVAARRAGYRSRSPNLAELCAHAMRSGGAFSHAGRGKYLRTGDKRPLRKRGRPKGSKNKHRSKRAKNSMSLVEAIVAGVRSGATVSPAEAGAAAKRKGYKSSSPNFGMMVANALAKAPMFKRLGRGQYMLKGGSPAPKSKRGRPAKAKRRGPGRTKGSKNKVKAKSASPTHAAVAATAGA